jgi:hypothetical protein
MYLKIKGWKGRLGNNIHQLTNALIYAKYLNMNFILDIKGKYFEKKTIIFFPNNKEKIFFFDENGDFTGTKVKINKINYEIKYKQINYYESIRKELLNMFYIKRKDIINYSDKTLIIYIRSGDLFPQTQKKVHPKYISAPYYYYEFILEKYKNDYKNYILVAEDNNNPVIKKILKNYSNIIWNKNNLETDLKIVLGASHIVSCVGTFIKSLSWLNPNMKKVYLPSFVGKRYYYPKLKFEKIELPGFKEKLGNWKNTDKQKDLLLNYTP